MNKDNAHLYLPLVQALAEGKTIQFKRSVENSPWCDCMGSEFSFGDSPEKYRIKPEPKTAWYRVAESTLGLMLCNNERDESLIEHNPGFKRWFERVTYEVTE